MPQVKKARHHAVYLLSSYLQQNFNIDCFRKFFHWRTVGNYNKAIITNPTTPQTRCL